MCNLSELTFSCGHKQFSLLAPRCPGAFDSDSDSKVRVSTAFCRNGIQVTVGSTSSEPCNNECRRKRAMQILSERYQEATAKIEDISQRASVVDTAAKKGPPGFRFTKHGARGWDPEMLDNMCRQALEEAHQLLDEYFSTKTELLNELKDMYVAAESAVVHYTVVVEGSTSELVSFDERPLEKFGNEAREQLHDLVCEIERRASEACLQKHGWVLPKEDEEQCEVLKERATWKKGFLSGTKMDDAYDGRVRR
jgi:hypothetical protein